MLFEQGDVGQYIKDYVSSGKIEILNSTEINKEEFKLKLMGFSQDVGVEHTLKDTDKHGLSVWVDTTLMFNNKGFIVISENEILYIHDFTLWSYIFEVKG